MQSTKPKPTGSWSNQVVRTSDGRFIVRGVDVPSKGAAWKSVSSGKPLPPTTKTKKSPTVRVLIPITDKNKALATARRAGLLVPSKTGSLKK